MAADFQDRLLDELMPAKLKKEAPVDGFKALKRLPAVQATSTALVKAAALNDMPDWRGTCAICLDLQPVEAGTQIFYDCCCKRICKACSDKCRQHDTRCPLCRAVPSTSVAEALRRLQRHMDKGNAEAQYTLGDHYFNGAMGLKKSYKRAFQVFVLAAAQGHAPAMTSLGCCCEHRHGAKIDHKIAVKWYRRAAEQGFPQAQINLASMFLKGTGVAHSFEEAVRWFRLAAAQGHPTALYGLSACHENGQGVPQDLGHALRLYKSAAAKGFAGAAANVERLTARLAATSRPPT
jgi:hypothetical protein